MRSPDIELTTTERELLLQIKFHSTSHEDIRSSLTPMVKLVESLQKRDAIPELRILYFIDPERNPGGYGKSREEIFERNGTSGPEIYAHPHFLKYLEYFIFGPDLPLSVIEKFKEVAASCSGYLAHEDLLDLVPAARALVRKNRLNPANAAEEFYRLALECGASPCSAETIRKQVRAVR